MSADIKLDEKISVEIKEPSLYNIIFLNDDFTPMDFVVSLLIELFRHSETTAADITMKIHDEGSGVVGTYSYEIAEQKALEVSKFCKDSNFPLRVKLEENK